MTIARLPFALEVRRPPDGSALLILSGECDLHNQAEVAEALHTEIDAGCTRIVVDLSQASFIDSSLLGALAAASNRLRRQGGDEFAVVSGDRQLRRVFEVTGLERVFSMYDRLEEAIPATRGGPDSRPA